MKNVLANTTFLICSLCLIMAACSPKSESSSNPTHPVKQQVTPEMIPTQTPTPTTPNTPQPIVVNPDQPITEQNPITMDERKNDSNTLSEVETKLENIGLVFVTTKNQNESSNENNDLFNYEWDDAKLNSTFKFVETGLAKILIQNYIDTAQAFVTKYNKPIWEKDTDGKVSENDFLVLISSQVSGKLHFAQKFLSTLN